MTDLFNTRWLSLADHAYREATAAAVDRGLPTAEARRHGLSAVVDAVRGLLGDEEPREGSVVPDTRTDPPTPGSGDEGHTIAGLLATTREIWSHRRLTPEQVVTLASVVVGDLARAVRDRTSEADLKRELGNLMLALEWAAALGYRPVDCIDVALVAQRAFVAGGRAHTTCSGCGDDFGPGEVAVVGESDDAMICRVCEVKAARAMSAVAERLRGSAGER